LVVTAGPDFVDAIVLTGPGEASQFDRGTQAVAAVRGDDKGSLDLSWTGVICCSEQTGPRRHVSTWVHGDRFEHCAALGDPQPNLAGVLLGRHRRFGPAEVAVGSLGVHETLDLAHLLPELVWHPVYMRRDVIAIHYTQAG
jgi:hypothetical protein